MLARTEVVRAVGRTDPGAIPAAWQLLQSVSIVEMDAALADQAAQLGPGTLRNLDALHLVSAMRLGPALGALVSYDERMLAAAQHHGLATASPGR